RGCGEGDGTATSWRSPGEWGPPATYGSGWWRMFPRTPDALKVQRRSPGAAAAASGDNGCMEIILNGQPLPLPDRTTVAGLLEAQHLAQRRVAVEVNGQIVPRGQHAGHVLAAGDRVEIVHALGGG